MFRACYGEAVALWRDASVREEKRQWGIFGEGCGLAVMEEPHRELSRLSMESREHMSSRTQLHQLL